ncbi:MAG: glycerol-3-phosphate 1-O-acyltransferase [Chloroflexota bacterium]|nr:MAG: glycerol-3-phosphate 1-O-acyltransferase [Chloroflexota bacterium]
MPDPVLGVTISVVTGYLLGSIPSGLLIGRWIRGVDVRTVGSGRTGATNVMRSLGAKGFATTFAADAGKAILAILVASLPQLNGADPIFAQCLAGLAAIVGHNWSIYIRFGGGRGVACSFGAMAILYWPGALAGLIAAAILIGLTRYVSLGSIVGTVGGATLAVVAYAVGSTPIAIALFGAVTAILVVAQHRDNIQRLLAGTERKIGERSRPQT